MLKNIKFSYKLYGGFGIILLLLVILGVSVFLFLTNVSDQSQNYVSYSGFSRFMVEKEVDHLKWVAKVKDLFVEHLAKLDVQLDYTQCGLGKFLYGDCPAPMSDTTLNVSV